MAGAAKTARSRVHNGRTTEHLGIPLRTWGFCSLDNISFALSSRTTYDYEARPECA
jgi:hypothetical protein